jgi:hypothetical protein
MVMWRKHERTPSCWLLGSLGKIVPDARCITGHDEVARDWANPYLPTPLVTSTAQQQLYDLRTINEAEVGVHPGLRYLVTVRVGIRRRGF